MKEYLEQCLRRKIEITEFEKSKSLPLLYTGLYLKNLNSYSKDIMLNEGIPFVVEGKQIYLPFIGVLLAREADRKLTPISQISYLTQKLLIIDLYEKWREMTVTKIAEDLKLEVKAGMSALCEYSMLEDNSFPTYAITKKELQKLQIKKKQLVPKGEEKGCVIQELGYYINFQKRNVVNPLTVLLSLSDEEKTDDRVSLSVEELDDDYYQVLLDRKIVVHGLSVLRPEYLILFKAKA